jgi:uncharacterized membrane protein YczE
MVWWRDDGLGRDPGNVFESGREARRGRNRALIFWVLVASLLSVTAWRYGADTRDGRDWSPMSGIGPPRRRPRAARKPATREAAARPGDRVGRTASSSPGEGEDGPRFYRRLMQLFAGLIGFGVSLSLMVKAHLGLGPWDVLHQGIARQTGLLIGWVVIGISALVLLLWVPLRERPGIGTAANAIAVGLTVNAALVTLPDPRRLTLRVLFLLVGIVANGIATGLYIGAGLGAGPRDGLMTGLARRGHSIRAARTSIELLVLGVGWMLGGTVGIGTVLYAFGIGPLAHYFIPRLTIAAPHGSDSPGTWRLVGRRRDVDPASRSERDICSVPAASDESGSPCCSA